MIPHCMMQYQRRGTICWHCCWITPPTSPWRTTTDLMRCITPPCVEIPGTTLWLCFIFFSRFLRSAMRSNCFLWRAVVFCITTHLTMLLVVHYNAGTVHIYWTRAHICIMYANSLDISCRRVRARALVFYFGPDLVLFCMRASNTPAYKLFY